MSISVHCILFYDTSPKEIIEEIKSSIDDKKVVDDYLPRSGEMLISTWQESNVMFLEQNYFICIPDKLAMLSNKHDMLICTVCEGAMVSECSKWEHGNLRWKVSFEPSKEDMIYKLTSLNFDPTKLQQLNAKATKEVQLYDLDETQVGFLVPIILFHEKTDFRYDENKFEEYNARFKHVITDEKISEFY